MVFRKPMALAIQPEMILPAKPLTANIIMVKPRSGCAFEASSVILWIHVGAQEKHQPDDHQSEALGANPLLGRSQNAVKVGKVKADE